MSLHFSSRPGPRERQLARQWNNPLFPAEFREITQAAVDAAAQQDREELAAFMGRFQALVREAMELDPNAESEAVLDLKARLDRAYTEGAGLPGNQAPVLDALRKLVETIMRAVRAAAAGDPTAAEELDQEAQAREAHYRLLAHPLVADLARPDSPVAPEALVPTLLTEPAEAVQAALWLFEAQQAAQLHRQGQALLERLRAHGQEVPAAWQNLGLLERAAAHSPGAS